MRNLPFRGVSPAWWEEAIHLLNSALKAAGISGRGTTDDAARVGYLLLLAGVTAEGGHGDGDRRRGAAGEAGAVAGDGGLDGTGEGACETDGPTQAGSLSHKN